MLITNQCAAQNYCLINSVINTLMTLLRWVFMLRVFEGKNFKRYNAENCNFPFLSKTEKIVSYKKEFIHPRELNICESKIKKNNFPREQLPGHRKKYDLNYISHIFKTKTMA